MPLYDLRCPKCLTTSFNVVQSADAVQDFCGSCNVRVERVWLAGPPVHTLQEGYYEHAADGDGKVPYFSSRQKYKDYLKEHGM